MKGGGGGRTGERRSCSDIKCRDSRRAQGTQPERSEAKGEETPQAAVAGGAGAGGGGVGAWVAALLLLPLQLLEPKASRHHRRESVRSNLATPTAEAPQAEPLPFACCTVPMLRALEFMF